METVSLDREHTLHAGGQDPRSFAERPVDTLVIDEAQREPRLFRAVKASVDAGRRPGRFVLTGSARLRSVGEMADALVGRVEVVELWPFSEVELTPGRMGGRRDVRRSAFRCVEYSGGSG